MKRGILCGAIFSVLMAGCTTVSLGEEGPSAHIVETAVKAKTAIAGSAKSLFYVFSKANWCPSDNGEQTQSAISILLKGLKKDTANVDNVEAYIATVTSVSHIQSDLQTARQHVDTVTVQAKRLLTENPELMDVHTELKSLETALIASRQAETTFSEALKHKAGTSASDTDSYMTAFSASVDALRDTTNAYGERMHHDASVFEAG